jgi:hypothetical protein
MKEDLKNKNGEESSDEFLKVEHVLKKLGK